MTSGPVRTGVAEAARCLALDQLAAEVLVALERADVSSVLLKGAGLAHRLYASQPDRRRYSDVDLLVAPASFDRAQEVLARAGLTDVKAAWRDDEWSWYERLWRLPGPPALSVDLHRSFVGVGDHEAFWEAISRASEPHVLCGREVRVPDAAGCALVVGLHAACPGPGRKPLTDLTAALALFPDAVWDDAAALARLTRSTGAFARGLCCHPAGAAQATRLGLSPDRSRADGWSAGSDVGAMLGLTRLSALPGIRAKVRYAAGRLVPSTAFMRYTSATARRGRLGLGAAYALRISQVVARTPGAALRLGLARGGGWPAWSVGLRRPGRMARALLELGAPGWATCGWAVLAVLSVRRQLARGPLDAVSLPGPPADGADGADGHRTVSRVARCLRASCLERALVRQRWWAAQGVARDLLIGVSAPGPGFHAHAWLGPGSAGGSLREDHAGGGPELVEILRRPAPVAWLSGSQA